MARLPVLDLGIQSTVVVVVDRAVGRLLVQLDSPFMSPCQPERRATVWQVPYRAETEQMEVLP
jgi:hypothetical protein